MTLDPAADITDVYAFVSYDEANLARPADAHRHAHHERRPGAGAELGPELLRVRRQRPLRAPRRQRPRRRRRRRDLPVPLPDRGREPGPVHRHARRRPAAAGDAPRRPGQPRPVAHAALHGDRAARLQASARRAASAGRDGALRRPARCRPCRRTSARARCRTTTRSRQQGIRTDAATGIRVFAGQRAETFAIDLGAVFDTVNLRVENATPIPMARPPLPVQTAAEDANDTSNPFGINTFSGFNVNTIALELPVRRLTGTASRASAANGAIGVYAQHVAPGAHRARRRARAGARGRAAAEGPTRLPCRSRAWRNPLVNELIIPIGRKDLWNATEPEDEAQFLDAYRDLDVAGALQAVSGVPVPPTPREDIVQLLLKYAGQDPSRRGPFSELLRLDLTVPPTPPAQIKRLGPSRARRRRHPDARPRRLPERPAPERRRHRPRRARRRRHELHPELRRRRRRREREGHHARLPLPADALRRPQPPARRSRGDVVIRVLALASWRAPIALLALVASPAPLPGPGRGEGPLPRVASRSWSTRPRARCARRARPATRPGTGTRAPRSTARSAIDPSDYRARCGRVPGCVLGQHEFRAARGASPSGPLAREPHDWWSWANLTDALVELGRLRSRRRGAPIGSRRCVPACRGYTRVAGLQRAPRRSRDRDRHARGRRRRRRARGAGDAAPGRSSISATSTSRSATAPRRAAAYERALAASPRLSISRSPASRVRAPRRAGLAEAIALADARRRARAGAGARHGLLGDLHAAAGDAARGGASARPGASDGAPRRRAGRVRTAASWRCSSPTTIATWPTPCGSRATTSRDAATSTATTCSPGRSTRTVGRRRRSAPRTRALRLGTEDARAPLSRRHDRRRRSDGRASRPVTSRGRLRSTRHSTYARRRWRAPRSTPLGGTRLAARAEVGTLDEDAARRAGRARLPGTRRRASARQLHHQSLRRARGRAADAVARPLRRRHGRAADVYREMRRSSTATGDGAIDAAERDAYPRATAAELARGLELAVDGARAARSTPSRPRSRSRRARAVCRRSGSTSRTAPTCPARTASSSSATATSPGAPAGRRSSRAPADGVAPRAARRCRAPT